MPYDTNDEKAKSTLEAMAVAGNTAELQEALGANESGAEAPEFEDDLESMLGDIATPELNKAKTLLKQVSENKNVTQNLKNAPAALGAATFLRTYGAQLAMDAAEMRAALTNKLMELANCGDPRFELKALELLGKHSDIGLFTDRSEVTINYKNPADLEKEIKNRVKRLLNATVVDDQPGKDLDAELGQIEIPEDDDG